MTLGQWVAGDPDEGGGEEEGGWREGEREGGREGGREGERDIKALLTWHLSACPDVRWYGHLG